MKLKKDDQVKVISGKDKGRTSQVIAVFPKKGKVLIKGVNLFKKHVKASQGKSGGIIEREIPLHASKVGLICPSCKKTTRVSYTKDEKTGKKIRTCRKCGKPIKKSIKVRKKTKAVKKSK